jgi:hypothetical protein
MYQIAQLGSVVYRERLEHAERQRPVQRLLALHRAERRMRRAERQVRRLRTQPGT